MAHCILVVEDHDWAREALASLISLEPGLTVIGPAANAEEALALLSDDVDLVVLDLALPGLSGLDLLKEIQQRRPGLPCIVFSGQPALENAAATREFGAVGYVEKGDSIGLLTLIHQTLNGAG